jgi:hypothetical protein
VAGSWFHVQRKAADPACGRGLRYLRCVIDIG